MDVSEEKSPDQLSWLEHYENGAAWVEEERARISDSIDRVWGRPRMNGGKMTISDVARRVGCSDSTIGRFLRGKKPQVDTWWHIRWALGKQVSGHPTYSDWSHETGAQLRTLLVGRHGSIDGAIKDTGLPPGPMRRAANGSFSHLKVYSMLMHALGVQMPEWKRSETVGIQNRMDDKLASPPMWGIEIPRGLLQANMTTDHIRVWMVLDRRDTPRSVAALLCLPAGYVSTILFELERNGFVEGGDSKLDFHRKYRRVPFIPVAEAW